MSRASLVGRILGGVLAIGLGCAIAWMDTRPGWDDTGVTAGSLLVAGLLTAVLGLWWWLAGLLVAAPIVLAEFHQAGWAMLLMLGFATAGGIFGAGLRAALRKH